MPASYRQQVQFLLGDKLVELSDVDPNRTVLQWLREDRGLCGSKEGCAEGDCGACAVVVAEPLSDSSLRWRVVNSCIQLVPTLDGKQLITVEQLSGADGSLHPVQQAMVDHHGSQCGFCTPGFVMALFDLYQNGNRPDRDAIDTALSGNLCRCTGYRPIIAAAAAMHDYPADRRDDNSAAVARRLCALRQQPPLGYTAGSRDFYAPVTIGQLTELLQAYPDAVLLAGGTDVGLWITKEYRLLDTLIFIGCIEELARIELTDTHLEIGAAVTLTDALQPLCELYPELEELLLRFAGPPIRNAATLGGNVANGSPIGDSMPALIALGATVVLRNASGTRELPLEQLYLGYRKTALAAGEFVEALRLPRPRDGQCFRAYKVSKRYDQDISAVCAAFNIILQGGSIVEARTGFGGVAATPARARHCEQALSGQAWNTATVNRAMTALDQDFTPLTDLRASCDYRKKLSRNLLARFYHDVSGQLPLGSLYRYGR